MGKASNSPAAPSSSQIFAYRRRNTSHTSLPFYSDGQGLPFLNRIHLSRPSFRTNPSVFPPFELHPSQNICTSPVTEVIKNKRVNTSSSSRSAETPGRPPKLHFPLIEPESLAGIPMAPSGRRSYGDTHLQRLKGRAKSSFAGLKGLFSHKSEKASAVARPPVGCGKDREENMGIVARVLPPPVQSTSKTASIPLDASAPGNSIAPHTSCLKEVNYVEGYDGDDDDDDDDEKITSKTSPIPPSLPEINLSRQPFMSLRTAPDTSSSSSSYNLRDDDSVEESDSEYVTPPGSVAFISTPRRQILGMYEWCLNSEITLAELDRVATEDLEDYLMGRLL